MNLLFSFVQQHASVMPRDKSKRNLLNNNKLTDSAVDLICLEIKVKCLKGNFQVNKNLTTESVRRKGFNILPPCNSVPTLWTLCP